MGVGGAKIGLQTENFELNSLCVNDDRQVIIYKELYTYNRIELQNGQKIHSNQDIRSQLQGLSLKPNQNL